MSNTQEDEKQAEMSLEELIQSGASIGEEISPDDASFLAPVDGGRFETKLEEEVEAKVEAAPLSTVPPTSKSTWLDTPSIPNQMEEMPDTVRRCQSKVDVFNLGITADLDRYNAILSKSTQPESPTVFLEDNQKQFYEGTYYACLTYANIQYKKLT